MREKKESEEVCNMLEREEYFKQDKKERKAKKKKRKKSMNKKNDWFTERGKTNMLEERRKELGFRMGLEEVMQGR